MPYKDPADGRARAVRYRAANRERLRDYYAAYRAAHRVERLSQVVAWQVANPVRYAAISTATGANRKAVRLGLPGRLTADDIERLWQAQPECRHCGKGRGLDHVVAMANGGSNTPDNIQTLCPPCNARKGVA